MGRLKTKQKDIYQVSSVNIIFTDLNPYLGMRFYDSNLITSENIKIYYNEANTLAIWGHIVDGEAYWRITTIANVENQGAPSFFGPFTPINGKPIGTYEDFFNQSDPPPTSSLVISEIILPSKIKISIKKQNLGGGKISSYDADVLNYFATANVTDPTAMSQISAFVKGVKSLGLWSNMVCWPLRSAQNKGSGLTAYSLGGYGTYNGTLTSSGLWSTNGLAIANNDYMDTGLTLGAYPDSVISVHTTTTLGPNNSSGLFTAGVNVNGRQFGWGLSAAEGTEILSVYRDTWATDAGSIGGGFVNNGLGGSGIGSRYISFRPQSNTTIKAGINGNVLTGTSIIGWAASSAGPLRARGYNAPNSNGFFAYLNTAISDSLDTQIRTLYKTTLGVGLGLP